MLEKHEYQEPQLEVVEFDPKDSIATSAIQGVSLWEEMWGRAMMKKISLFILVVISFLFVGMMIPGVAVGI